MYTIIDIMFASLILIIGVIIILHILVSGTPIGITPVQGVMNCVYSELANGVIPTLLELGLYSQVIASVKSCGATSAALKIGSTTYYPSKTSFENILGKCTVLQTLTILLHGNVYQIIVCIK